MEDEKPHHPRGLHIRFRNLDNKTVRLNKIAFGILALSLMSCGKPGELSKRAEQISKEHTAQVFATDLAVMENESPSRDSDAFSEKVRSYAMSTNVTVKFLERDIDTIWISKNLKDWTVPRGAHQKLPLQKVFVAKYHVRDKPRMIAMSQYGDPLPQESEPGLEFMRIDIHRK